MVGWLKFSVIEYWRLTLITPLKWLHFSSSFIYLWWRRRYMFSPELVCQSVCLSVCLSVCVRDYSSTRAWIWMKCCVSTDVVTWTNWLTFEPDPDHSADAATGKSMICRSPSNRHLTQRRLQVTWCTAERYCLLHVVVQGPGSFANTVDFSVRRRPTVAELRGVNVAQFSDFGLFSP